MRLELPPLPCTDEVAAELRTTVGEEGIDALIARHIRRDPQRSGIAEVIVGDYHVHVWALIGYIEASEGDLEAVAAAYAMPFDGVRAAVAFYVRFPQVIAARIDANAFHESELSV